MLDAVSFVLQLINRFDHKPKTKVNMGGTNSVFFLKRDNFFSCENVAGKDSTQCPQF